MTVAVLLLVSGALHAQSASFRSIDTNSDGVLTIDELVTAFGRDGAMRLLRTADHSGDGRITIAELRRAPVNNESEDTRRSRSSGKARDNEDDTRDGEDDSGDRGDNDEDDDGDDD